MYRGKKHPKDIGKVAAFKGLNKMEIWRDECNEYVGTDSTVFPAFADVNDGIWGFEPQICRSLGAHYVGKSKYMGVHTSSFEIDIGRDWNVKECFCRETGCPKKGLKFGN